ncbi:hypothetical protein KM043_010594 [Ampulex compressa]|nr:hypothetical protein KM043_010594 [Ampulex compressa]
MYKTYNHEDEFEPRITPKPATRFECLTVPSVPEVSLIFDKPLQQKSTENRSYAAQSPKLSDCTDVSKKNSASRLSKNSGSYAAWKEENFSLKSASSRVKDSSNLTNVQYASNYAVRSCTSTENVVRTPEQRRNRRALSQSNAEKYAQHERHEYGEHNGSYTMQKRDTTTAGNDAFSENHADLGHMMPRSFKVQPSNDYRDSSRELVNSQSDQIKYLQAQVERLLKMQEETFKEKQRCLCPSRSQHDDAADMDSSHATSNSSHISSSHNQSGRKTISQPTSTMERTVEYIGEDDNLCDLVHKEQQSKKAFLEQKVSIGVMTSFEFTVQNSPFLLDSESYDREESHQKNDNTHAPNGGNICDKAETLRRYKSSFTRMPSGQLENIVEDSESYMSSTQQQSSSNPNISCSGKDLEKQNQQDTLREMAECDSRNACARQELQNDPIGGANNGRTNLQKYMGKIDDEGTRHYDLRTNPTVQINNNKHNPPQSESYNITGMDDPNSCAKLNAQRYDCFKKTNLINGQTKGRHYPKVDNPPPTKQNNCIEDSLILSGGDLRVNERPPPTPDPSIHVEMQEYSSDEDSDKVKRTSKVGWTFYNNVLGQVNQILQDSCVVDEQNQNNGKPAYNVEQEDADNKAALETVKVATLEQLRKLGISLAENTECRDLHGNQKMAFDSSFYPRLDCQANVTQTTSAINETSTSMHMKALALKYLSDEQLAELAMQKQGSASLKHMMLSNVQGTNMSFATMRYLERYQLLPGKNNAQNEENSRISTEVPVKADLMPSKPKNSPLPQRYPLSQTPRTSYPSKILDISTLKQQPKLL